jgi:hypothetical protein
MARRSRPSVVELAPCGTAFVHRIETWSITLPLARLPSWRAFYARLAVKRPQFYAAHVAALDAFSESLTE